MNIWLKIILSMFVSFCFRALFVKKDEQNSVIRCSTYIIMFGAVFVGTFFLLLLFFEQTKTIAIATIKLRG